MAGRYSVETIFKAVDDMTAPIKKMEKGVEGLVKKAESGGKSMVAMGAAILGSLGAAAFKAMDYEAALNDIAITADMTAAEVAKLDKEIQKSAMSSGLAMQDVAEAAGSLIAKGMSKDVVGSMLPSLTNTATAAKASMEDVATATFTLNDTLGVTADNMERVQGILITSGKAGSFEYNKMAKFLPAVGAQFKSLKMEGEEAAATMGAALQVAMKGAGSEDEAANNLQNALRSFTSPSTLKAAEKMGSDLYGVIEKAQKTGGNPFEAAIKEIDRVTKGGNAKLLGQLAPDAQVQAFLRPILANMKDYEAIKKEALDAQNVVAIDALKQEATAAASWSSLKEQLGNAAIIVGMQLTPAISILSQGISSVVLKLDAWRTENPELFNQIVKIVTVVGLLFVGIGALMLIFSAVVGPVMFAAKGIMILTGVVRFLTMALIANPIILILTILIGLAIAIVANWDVVGPFFKNLWAGIVEAFVSAKNWIMGIIDDIIGGATRTIEKLAEIGGKVKSFFGGGGSTDVNVNAKSMQGHRAANTSHTDRSEVTIKDETGRAAVTKGNPGRGVLLPSSGKF